MGLSHTVSGDIASFRTPSRVPIESLKFHFLPKQDGSGDPSPTNVCPITGWTGLNGHQQGKNLINKNELTGTDKVWWKGSVISGYADHCVTPKIPVKPGASYYLYRKSTNSTGGSGQGYLCYFGKDGTTYLGQEQWQDNGVGNPHVVPDDVYYVGITVGTLHKDSALLQFAGQSTSYGKFTDDDVIPITFPTDDENKFNNTVENGNIASNGATIGVSNDRLITNDFIYLPAGVYTLSSQQNYPCAIYVYSDQNESSYVSAESLSSWNNSPVVFTLTRGRYIRLKWKNNTDTQISPSDLTNIQIKLCTFYGGGYYDPIAGEIVCSWRKFKLKEYEWVYKPGNNRFQMQLASKDKANAASSGWTNFAISDSYKTSNYAGYVNLMIASYGNNNIYIRDDTYEDADDFVEAMGEVEIAYELANPIHIPVTPQDLQAFLDHNNFWSDANDITEVTYAVTESKDILETRKRISSYNIGDYIKDGLVLWMDGIDKGDVSGAWIDKVAGHVFTSINGMTVGNNHIALTRTLSQMLENSSFNADVDFRDGTIEVVISDYIQTSAIVFAPRIQRGLCFGFGSGGSIIYCVSIGSDNVANHYIIPNANNGKCFSINNNKALIDGETVLPSSTLSYFGQNYPADNHIGGRVYTYGGSTTPNYFDGKIYAIRIYNRQLTKEEMLHNQRIDNRRFNLHLGIS